MASSLKKLIQLGILPKDRAAFADMLSSMEPEQFDVLYNAIDQIDDEAVSGAALDILDSNAEDPLAALKELGDTVYGVERLPMTGIRGKQPEAKPEVNERVPPQQSKGEKKLLADTPKEEAPPAATGKGAKKATGKAQPQAKDAPQIESNDENMFLIDQGFTEQQIAKMKPADRRETLKDLGYTGAAAEPAGAAPAPGESPAMQQARQMIGAARGGQQPSDPGVVRGPDAMFSDVAAPNFAPVTLPSGFSMDTMSMPSRAPADIGAVTPGNPGVMFQESVLPSPEMLPGVRMVDSGEVDAAMPDQSAMDMSRMNSSLFPTIEQLEQARIDPMMALLSDPRFNAQDAPAQPENAWRAWAPGRSSAPSGPENVAPPPPEADMPPEAMAEGMPPEQAALDMPPAMDMSLLSRLPEPQSAMDMSRLSDPRFRGGGGGGGPPNNPPGGGGGGPPNNPPGGGGGKPPLYRPVSSRAPEFLRRMGSGFVTEPIDHVIRNAIPYGTLAAAGGLGYALSGGGPPPVPQDQMDAVDEMRRKARADLESVIGPMAIPLPPGMQIRAVPQSE
jgi:hypothetical protein